MTAYEWYLLDQIRKSAAVGGWNCIVICPKSNMNKLLSNVPPFQFVSVGKNWTETFSKQS